MNQNSDVEATVIKHYERGNIADSILEQAREKANDPSNLSVDDLKRFDQMHIGGYESAEDFFTQMGFAPKMEVLDIGSGLGGPARLASSIYNINVYGLDLTPEYEAAAKRLSRAVNLGKHTDFICASATDMPFEDKVFDAAYMIHAGMNIRDKKALIDEVARVLKLGSVFGVYDVFAMNDDVQIQYPMPWAQNEETSFVVTKDEMVQLLETRGFEILNVVDHYDTALSAMEGVIAKGDQPEMFVNLHNAIKKFRLSPFAIYARR